MPGDDNTRLWCVYVLRSAEVNFRIAREHGYWGAKQEAHFQGIEAGDAVLFVHDISSDQTPAPAGFPRVKFEDFHGTAQLVVHGVVTKQYYETTPTWPNGIYPYRFRFTEANQESNVTFNISTFPKGQVEAIRLSAIKQGQPILGQSTDEGAKPSEAAPSGPVLDAHAELAAMEAASDDGDSTGPVFDPTSLDDARKRALRAIVQRQGQPQFRDTLLKAYGGRCAVTGCDAVQALEAAHIIGYLGPDTNHVSNGLLLRADIHTLFDLGLLAVDTRSMSVLVAPSLAGTVYGELAGRPLRLPVDAGAIPSAKALDEHRTGAGL